MLTSNWKMTAQRIRPIGLDIGHRSLRMVQLASSEGRVRVHAVRRAPIDPNLEFDAPEGRQSLVLAIRKLLGEGDFKGRKVISSLPVDKLKITSLRLEADTPHAEKVLRREAAERFGLDPRRDAIHYALAGTVRQGDEAKEEYILFATDDESIRNHITLLEEAGLTPTGIDAPSCALFRACERTMRRQEDREKTTICIDVGYRYTMVVFGRSGEICFVKEIPIGMGRFDGEVASALDIAPSDAELLRLKLQRDEPVDADTRRHVIDALNVMAEQLAAEISLCLRYYTVTFRGKRVDRAIIAGGGAYEEVLIDVFRRHLSVETEIAEPLRGFDLTGIKENDEGAADRPADLTLAVGLGLKGLEAAASDGDETGAPIEPVLEGEPA